MSGVSHITVTEDEDAQRLDRVLRKRFRTELAKSGEDEEVISQKIEKIAAAVTRNEAATF